MRRAGIVGGSLLLLLAASGCDRGADKSASPKPQAAAKADAETGPDEDAVAALKAMSAYLTSLNSFDLVSDGTLDAVTKAGQRIQLGGIAHYKLKKPGIWLDFNSDVKTRRYFYDGKQFTIFAPKLHFYATMPAPPTNREFLKLLYDKYGISLPAADLFRWNDGDNADLKALTSGFSVGSAIIDGFETEHWAFRQGTFDWEVWIQQGAQPLPRKLVIVDRSDPTYPTYSAHLKWTVNPPLATSIFTFVPDKDAQKIRIAQFTGGAK